MNSNIEYLQNELENLIDLEDSIENDSPNFKNIVSIIFKLVEEMGLNNDCVDFLVKNNSYSMKIGIKNQYGSVIINSKDCVYTSIYNYYYTDIKIKDLFGNEYFISNEWNSDNIYRLLDWFISFLEYQPNQDRLLDLKKYYNLLIKPEIVVLEDVDNLKNEIMSYINDYDILQTIYTGNVEKKTYTIIFKKKTKA